MARRSEAVRVGCLILLGQVNSSVHSFRLIPRRKYAVGRSSSSDFVVRHPSVSRSHAELSVSDFGIAIKDLGSRNGTYIESSRVVEGKAVPGQRLRFGDVSFLVTALSGALEEGSADPTDLGANSRRPADHFPDISKLTPAQARVFDLLLQGFSEKELAYRLGLSANTVHHHVSAIYRAMCVSSRAEFMARAQLK